MSSRSSRNTPVVILVALFLLGVGVWASSPIFWPQHQYSDPTAPGTLGGVMEYFASGVAPDADTLDGISSTWYLQGGTPCVSGKVWGGIDAHGSPICTDHGALLTLSAEIISGEVTLGTTRYRAPQTFTIEGNSLLKTNATTPADIIFTSDWSVLRMDRNTQIRVVGGHNTGGQTVAQAILEHGVLWGRVLTSTGVNFGNGWAVVGVRGTSVHIDTDRITVIDSLTTSGSVLMESNQVIHPGCWVQGASTIDCKREWGIPSPNALIKSHTDYQKYTRADIAYLRARMGTHPDNTRLQAELQMTEYGQGDTGRYDVLCGALQRFWPGMTTTQAMCTPETVIGQIAYSSDLMVFWQSDPLSSDTLTWGIYRYTLPDDSPLKEMTHIDVLTGWLDNMRICCATTCHAPQIGEFLWSGTCQPGAFTEVQIRSSDFSGLHMHFIRR